MTLRRVKLRTAGALGLGFKSLEAIEFGATTESRPQFLSGDLAL